MTTDVLSYEALMVTYNHKTEELGFVTRTVRNTILPENNYTDISYLIQLCNETNVNDDINYVDMCGYSIDGDEILWENEYEDC